MKMKLIMVSACLSALLISCNNEKKNVSANDNLFGKGEEIKNNNFTGKTWLNMMIEADSLNQISVGNVTFSPGARTRWHSHPGGQILLATDGTGYYQEKGSPIKILRKGEFIKCPPNAVHWHGASPDEQFVQVAITGREAGAPVWLQPVTDEEYQGKKK
jgi:quercetin dioxygenase-like cupin family protein